MGTPNTERLELDAAGIATDDKGFVTVNAAFATKVEGVYAFGDVIGPPTFTHSALDDADTSRMTELEPRPFVQDRDVKGVLSPSSATTSLRLLHSRPRTSRFGV